MKIRVDLQTDCLACGIMFTPIDAAGRVIQKARRWPFCSPLCARAQYLISIAMKKSIVDLKDDGVICLICNRKLEIAGTHFSRVHGIQATDCFTDRQEAFGLPQGARLDSPRIIDMKRKRAFENGFAKAGGDRWRGVRQGAKTERQRQRNPNLSPAQRINTEKMVIAGRKHCVEILGHCDAPRTKISLRKCPTCGKSFFRSVYRRTMFCSLTCRPFVNADKLRKSDERRHLLSVIRHTRTCIICNKEFFSPSDFQRKVRFCSPKCQGIGLRRPKPPCKECDAPAKGRGLCSKHYQRMSKKKMLANKESSK